MESIPSPKPSARAVFVKFELLAVLMIACGGY
jgi:hypothetical protein